MTLFFTSSRRRLLEACLLAGAYVAVAQGTPRPDLQGRNSQRDLVGLASLCVMAAQATPRVREVTITVTASASIVPNTNTLTVSPYTTGTGESLPPKAEPTTTTPVLPPPVQSPPAAQPLLPPIPAPPASESEPVPSRPTTQAAPDPAAATGPAQQTPHDPMGMMPRDPVLAGFLGGNPPNSNVDLPLTIVFLVLFALGAFTHISIYRANAKRGHKFLLSELIFDFCMVRTMTCIFRITWIFTQVRGVILLAQIFFNGGAAVIFAVNIFLTQRIVRSMHPRIGWSVPFRIGTRLLAISVPAVILVQITAIITLFFSTDNESRFSAAEGVLKFGSSWNMFLVVFPFLFISLACAVPGPRPDKFGSGSLRVKTSLVMFASALLTTGAVVRTYAFFNPRPPMTDDVLYSKKIFYTTQFMLEIFVVVLYGLLRFDLLFHIPNGASGPGDYSRPSSSAYSEKHQPVFFSSGEIRERLDQTGIPYQILKSSYSTPFAGTGAEPVIAVLYTADLGVGSSARSWDGQDGDLPLRVRSISQRQSFQDAFRPRPVLTLPTNPRPVRMPTDMTQSTYRTTSWDDVDGIGLDRLGRSID